MRKSALQLLSQILFFWVCLGTSGIAVAGDQTGCGKLALKYQQMPAGAEVRARNFHMFEAASAGCSDFLQTLIAEGASIKARNRFGNTPLLLAARNGHGAAVDYLLSAGADVTHRNLAGSSALLRATAENHTEVALRLLQAGADAREANNSGISALIQAAFNGNDQLVLRFLQAGADPARRDETGKSALIYAAGKAHTETVRQLLLSGVDVNETDRHHLTPLMWVAGYGDDVDAVKAIATLQLLADKGAAINATDDRGRTALMIAAARGHAQIITHLLQNGADAGRKDKAGNTALVLAKDDMVRRLLNAD